MISNLQSKKRHEWNVNNFPKYLFMRWERITFHLWKFSSQSFWNQEHCKLIVFEDISTYFCTRFSKLLYSVLGLNFGRELCHISIFLNFWLVYVAKLIDFKLQIASKARFSETSPAISHLLKVGFNSENRENTLNLC